MAQVPARTLERGVLTISLDFELIWGTLDLFGPERFRQACELERPAVIRLLEMFAEFKISATWCILGHLFLKSCAAENQMKHPEIVRPHHAWCNQDWFHDDPCGDEESAPIFYGCSLIDRIQNCPVPQEIGCHSFSHVIFGDPGCSRATAQSELRACVQLAKERGISLRSFAFPRNSVGHLDVLRDHGFSCYRGPEPTWYERSNWPRIVKRLAHLWDVIAGRQPPVVMPLPAAPSLWNIPGSMILFPMHGIRRFIPSGVRVRRAIRGLNAAADQRKVFHLWFHPTNLADHTAAMFENLRRILEHATTLRDSGRLDILPMNTLVPQHQPAVATAC